MVCADGKIFQFWHSDLLKNGAILNWFDQEMWQNSKINHGKFKKKFLCKKVVGKSFMFLKLRFELIYNWFMPIQGERKEFLVFKALKDIYDLFLE